MKVRSLCRAVVSVALLHAAGAWADETPWKTLGTLPGVAVQDLSFVTGDVGFAAGGNGQIWRTTNGARDWSVVLEIDDGHYWYGVQALNARDIVVSGFIDTADVQTAVIRWSHDGGDAWSDDLVLSTADWAKRVHFWDGDVGFAMSGFLEPNGEFRTSNGGLFATDWSAVTIDPNGGWFGAQFSALPNGHVRVSGITYCESLDYAATWQCRPSIDEVSDDATYFVDDLHGWVGGGGGIADENGGHFEGWLHVTTDGGATWSERTLDDGWPINQILFVNAHDGWAMGGGGDFGGAYASHDGGQTWNVEFDSGTGFTACATADYHIYCAAYDDANTTHFYTRDYDHILVDEFGQD